MIIQYILVIVIVAGAVGFAIVITLRRNDIKNKSASCNGPSSCEGCTGCSLKQELLEKSSGKGLFPLK